MGTTENILLGLLLVVFNNNNLRNTINNNKILLDKKLEKIEAYFNVLRYYNVIKIDEMIQKNLKEIDEEVEASYYQGTIGTLEYINQKKLLDESKNKLIKSDYNFIIAKLKYDKLFENKFNLSRSIIKYQFQENLLDHFKNIIIDDKELRYKFNLLKADYNFKVNSFNNIKKVISSNKIILDNIKIQLERGQIRRSDVMVVEIPLLQNKLELLNLEYDLVILKYKLLIILQYCDKYSYQNLIESLANEKDYFKSEIYETIF